jgi:adenosylcobinamide kinase/adenosylcobinamide-phosphate guanylyltransferase
MLTLIIGGARSGKSRFAQSLCATGRRVTYLATARIEDDEMRMRIARHRQDRPLHWTTIEEPLAVAGAVARSADSDFILLDCLTVWLSNFCWERRDGDPELLEQAAADEISRLAAAAQRSHVIVVTNEVGSGIVPEHAVARFFRDVHGLVNQQLARAADQVYHVVAGIPVAIKSPGARS